MTAGTQPVGKSCKSNFFEFHKNPIKPNKTGKFPLRGPHYPLRYARDTKIHSKALIEDLVLPNFLSVAGMKRQG
jgi:hypothetical protein